MCVGLVPLSGHGTLVWLANRYVECVISCFCGIHIHSSGIRQAALFMIIHRLTVYACHNYAGLNAGLIGLSLTYALSLADMLQYTIRLSAEVENTVSWYIEVVARYVHLEMCD